MKKLLLALFAVLCVFSLAAAETTQFSTKNIVVGAEMNSLKTDFDDVNVVGLSVGHWLDAGLTSKITDFNVAERLVTVGYNLSDNFTPYIVLGDASVTFTTDLLGAARLGHHSFGTTLATSEFSENVFEYGAGATGNLVTLPADILLGYDFRWTTFKASEKNESLTLLPAFYGGIALDDYTQKIQYNKFNILMGLSKEFVLKCKDANCVRKYFTSITPMVGYNYAYTTLDKKNALTICDEIGVSTSGSHKQSVGTPVVGVKTQITKNVSAGAMASLGKSTGIMSKVTITF